MYETLFSNCQQFAGLLAAGQLGLLRELLPHTFGAAALRDPATMEAWEQGFDNFQGLNWKDADSGHCGYTAQSFTLQARALAALADDGKLGAAALRAWLPSQEELIMLAERHHVFAVFMSGAGHPSLACATLYGTRLGAWSEAIAIASGILAIEPRISMGPLTRIEAWRLLARGQRARGADAAAREALQEGLAEAKLVGYKYMEEVIGHELAGEVNA